MNPQAIDERRTAAARISKSLSRFLFRTIMLMCIQCGLIAVLIAASHFRSTDAYGITQSGDVFKLKEKKT